jgi:pepsin A
MSCIVSFPAEADLKKGQKSRIFNVSPDVWNVYDHGNNNCTAILGGTNALGSGADAAWLLGQSFFAGHYVDFDIKAHTIGYGDLADPSMKNCA